ISAFDIDPACVSLARDNARKAGVDDLIKFSVADARKPFGAAGSLIVTNPPYGERMFELREAEALYEALGKTFKGSKAYIISSHNEFETHFGRKAVKKRKLYNGMIRCDLYMYY
ncbi:MAG: class I SAM-dependent RNA methyltransferase, partial [Oscillospiraceae bacterium]|nr:class I SAM-dependent RNA methyltransferase [Oscillospiraceae bacterium]